MKEVIPRTVRNSAAGPEKVLGERDPVSAVATPGEVQKEKRFLNRASDLDAAPSLRFAGVKHLLPLKSQERSSCP